MDNEQNKTTVFKIPFIAWKFNKILKDIKPDILHAFNLKWSGWIAALSNYSLFILSGLGSDILIEQGAEKNLLLKFLRRLTLSRSSHIKYVSKHIQKQILDVNSNVPTSFFIPGAKLKKNTTSTISDTKQRFNIHKESIILSPRYRCS